MKKIIMTVCFLLCLCACQKQSNEPVKSTFVNKELDYKIERRLDIENDKEFIPMLTGCDSAYLYGRMLNGAETAKEINTNRLLVIEDDWLRNFPLAEAPVVADHIMIKDQLYYVTTSHGDHGTEFALYRYQDGKYDEFLDRMYEENKLWLKRFGSTFLIITQNQERINVRRFDDDGIVQMATIQTDGELSGESDIYLYKTDLFLTVSNDNGTSIYEIDSDSGKIKHQLKNISFDYFVVSDEAIALYNDNSETVYDRNFQALKTYDTAKLSMSDAEYFGENNGIGVMVDADKNILLHTYQNDNLYTVSAEKESILKDLTIKYITDQYIIATTADHVIYKISFEINE